MDLDDHYLPCARSAILTPNTAASAWITPRVSVRGDMNPCENQPLYRIRRDPEFATYRPAKGSPESILDFPRGKVFLLVMH